MKEIFRLTALPIGLLLALGCTLGPIRAQEPTATLKLSELLDLARKENPRLQAAIFRVEATRTREAAAGLLPDPTLMVGVANLAIPEFSATMPASMVPSFQATQRFPLAGKRSLREEIARQSTEIDGTTADQIWWTLRTEVASAFYELYRIDRQTEVLLRTLGLLQDFETVALSMYSAGTGPQADVLRAGVAVARMEADVQRLSALRKGKAGQLNALVNRPADEPVPTPELLSLPADIPPPETLAEWAVETRPALQGLQLVIRRASSNVELAGKAIWPDLTLGIQYALGRMNGDPRSMGGASLGFTLPLYAGRRQHKLREEAAALESMARAHFDEALAAVDSELTRSLAELDRAGTLLQLYQEDILSQARATVESSLSSYRVGAVDFMALIDAQMAENRFQGEYFDLLASYGAWVAQLEMTIGREIPVTDNFISEIR